MTAFEIDKERCLEDVCYLARHVLGMDYWKDWQSGKLIRSIEWDGEKRDCGIVRWGPHGQMADFLDGESKNKLLLASRGSLKTSFVQAKIIQKILRDPDVRILVGMYTYAEARKMISTVKGHFEQNRILRHLFGDMVGETWTKDGLIVANRKQQTLRDPTLAGFGTDKPVTGGHYDVCFYDDPVTWQMARSLDQLNKSKSCYEGLIPVMDPGSEMVVTMTPYDENDLSFHIRGQLGEQFDVLELDCGMSAGTDGKGGYGLIGEPRFPHMPEGFLKTQLERMGPQEFNAQYALTITNPADQVFFREQFHPAEWQDRFALCNAYILTDTATSDLDHACFTAIALVVLDYDDTAYLCDLRVGRWTPDLVVDRWMDLFLEWHSRSRIVGCTMENGALAKFYRANIETELRKRGLTVNFIGIPRGIGAPAKNQRIRGLTSRFGSGRFKVLPSVPRTFHDKGREKLLWDPAGFIDPATNNRLPAGELVDEFTRFRYSGGDQMNVDIADAIADLDAVNSQGKRFVWPTAPTMAIAAQPRGGLPFDTLRPKKAVMPWKGKRTRRSRLR